MEKGNKCVILDLATETSTTAQETMVKRVREDFTSDSILIVMTSEQSSCTDSQINSAETFASNLPTASIFKAKTWLDDRGVHEFVLVTSLAVKKYWERMCVNMFSCVHTWSVVGVDVGDQKANKFSNVSEKEVIESIRSYLQTVGTEQSVNILRTDLIPEKTFNAGYHTRGGGVSQLKSLASMNMLYTTRKPDPMLVIEENRRRLAVAGGFPVESLHIVRVEHGNAVWVVGRDKEPPVKYDALVTATPGVTLAAAGADCCIILLADAVTGACGAIHAGWAGTVKAAVKSALLKMVEEFGTHPKDVFASIGPSISSKYFSILAEDVQILTDLDPSLTYPNENDPECMHVDLVRANSVILQKCGVPENQIDLKWALCTVSNPDKFFSYQRDKIPFGNQFGFISCRKS